MNKTKHKIKELDQYKLLIVIFCSIFNLITLFFILYLFDYFNLTYISKSIIFILLIIITGIIPLTTLKYIFNIKFNYLKLLIFTFFSTILMLIAFTLIYIKINGIGTVILM